MPKNKAPSSESDAGSLSGSGSESENEKPVAKKQKKEKKDTDEKAEKEAGKGYKNDQGDMVFELGKNKRVTVREFKGNTYVDIREFYDAGGGKFKPGKKGISLNAEQWDKVKDLMSDIDDAVSAT